MKSILLVDDNRQSLCLVRDWLLSAGHHVIALSDFHAAKNYLALNVPDATVADVRIHEHNGLDLLALQRRVDPKAVTIVVTGFDDTVLRSEAARLDAHYLLKPIAAEELLKLLA